MCVRIKEGKFELDGKQYALAVNNGVNHLHGGLIGFDKRVWGFRTEGNEDRISAHFFLLSPDGEEGYPGNLEVSDNAAFLALYDTYIGTRVVHRYP